MNFDNFEIVDKFKSKKNDVFKILCNFYGEKNFFVLKRFLDSDKMNKEIQILKELKNNHLKVPEIFHVKNNNLIMEFIDGKTFLDIFEELEKSNSSDYKNLIDNLLHWLENFYTFTKIKFDKQIILGDIHLRNFLFSKEIYGIDFEDTKFGTIEEDIGKLCAFILTYDPSWTTWKKTFSEILTNKSIKLFKIDESLITLETQKELNEIEKRRNLKK